MAKITLNSTECDQQILNFDCPNAKISYPLYGIYRINWLAVAIVNLILAPLVFIINFLTLIALRKAKDRHTIRNYIFTSLCTADMFTGSFAQTLYGIFYVNVYHNRSLCSLLLVTNGTAYIFVTISFVALLGIHVERYIGIFHPFQYEKISPHDILIKKIIIVTWAADATLMSLCLLTPNHIMFKVSAAILIPTAFIFSCYVQVKIAGQVYRITTNLRKTAPELNSDANRRERYLKHARSRANKLTELILAAYIICYSPCLIIYILRYLDGKSKELLTVMGWTETLVFVNSIFNPLLLCLQRRDVRETIVTMIGLVAPCSTACRESETES